MSVSQENLKEAEKEAQDVWNTFQEEMNKLFDAAKEKPTNGLGPTSEEEKVLLAKLNEEMTAIRKKNGIEPAPKE